MVDGFGWFEATDYRRAWLFFDDVVYVIPKSTLPPLVYLPGTLRDMECVTLGPEFSAAAWRAIGEAAQTDIRNPEFLRIVATIPQSDLRYTAMVAACDRELAYALNLDRVVEPALAIALLLEKLLLYASANGLVPIVGRRWASKLLETKLSWAASGAKRPLLLPHQAATYATFAAGLSLDFVDDRKLAALAFERLREFKDGHRALLDRHQLHLIEITRAFSALPSDDARDAALADLRLGALKRRLELDGEARQAVLTLGFDLVKKGIDSALSKEGVAIGVATALALDHSAVALLGGALFAGLGQSLSGLVELWRSQRTHQPMNALAYLFATEHL